MKIFSYIVVLFLIVLGISFAILNAGQVSIHYYIGVSHLPLSLLLVFSFGIGLIIGLLLTGVVILRLKAQKRSLKKRLKVVEKEIENLRTIPIKDER